MTGRRDWVARLRPEGEVDLDQREIVEDAVARVGADPVRWAIEVSAAVVRRIIDGVPALGGHPAAVEVLRLGNEATTLRTLVALVDDASVAPPPGVATLDSIREFVHRGIPLEEVLQGSRIGHAATTEAFLRACAALVDPDAAAGELTAISGELFVHINDLSDTMIRTYLAEHEVWSSSAAAARAGLVRDLLSDTGTADVDEASRVLGYDLRRTHEAMVVWSDSPDSRLQAAAAEVLRARGATATLVIPVAAGRLWAWGAVSADHSRISSDEIAGTLSRQQLQVAFGTAAEGVEGFRRSLREADSAEHVERLRRGAGQVPRHATAYADVAVAALLATDLDAAGEFVRRELGELAVRSASMAALRTTLHHYLGADRSLVEVARQLHVAKGTVTYRVKRAQEVLGRDAEDRRFALQTALALAEELGDAVLLPGGARPESTRQANERPGF